MGFSLNLNTCLLSNVKKWFVVAGDPGLHHKWQGTILLIPEGLYICMSQGLRHPPLAPHHDIMVSACHDVLVCWLCWMLQFVLARGRERKDTTMLLWKEQEGHIGEKHLGWNAV